MNHAKATTVRLLPASDADERMRHDYPILQQFHSKHALGALSAPSCLWRAGAPQRSTGEATMISTFCDCCGEEISARNTTASGNKDLGRLTATVKPKPGGNAPFMQVEVITANGTTWNGGHFCKYCVIDALNRLDDRPQAVPPPPSVWLVEKRKDGRTAAYLGHECGSRAWVPTPGKATRFARREDASGVADCIETDEVIVAEHQWGL